MQDSIVYEADPTHPLGAGESWPESGPVYHVPAPDEKNEPERTLWQRFTASTPDTGQATESVPGSLPVWY